MALTTALIVGGIATFRRRAAKPDAPSSNWRADLRSSWNQRIQALRQNRRSQLVNILNVGAVETSADQRRLNREVL
ncbi:MAG: hypothetical protein KDE47_19745, partial [Caldilineaceae bacterium]|nr:hypothetical protein [Caldilineaceae bacterium]